MTHGRQGPHDVLTKAKGCPRMNISIHTINSSTTFYLQRNIRGYPLVSKSCQTSNRYHKNASILTAGEPFLKHLMQSSINSLILKNGVNFQVFLERVNPVVLTIQ